MKSLWEMVLDLAVCTGLAPTNRRQPMPLIPGEHCTAIGF